MTIPDTVHELIEYEVAYARAVGESLGYQQCLIDTAARGYELDDAWKLVARKTADQWLVERLAEMERWAAQLAEKMGRPAGYVYLGGPVPVWPADPPKEDRFNKFARELWEEAR